MPLQTDLRRGLFAGQSWPQDCSVLYGNALIRPVIADITNPDLKSPSCQGLKSPSYQGLTLVSPGVGTYGSLNLKFYDIREVGAGRCQDQVLA